MSTTNFDAILIEKPGEMGLTLPEIEAIFDKLSEKEVYPVEIENSAGESSAMGFITTSAAEKIDFIYDNSSAFGHHVAHILSDMTNETPDGTYTIQGLNVLITR